MGGLDPSRSYHLKPEQACLSIRSGSLDEITGALYTLVATNVAMAVTALILGSKTLPEISFHEYVTLHQ